MGRRYSSHGKFEFVNFVVDKTSQGRHSLLHHFATNITFITRDVAGFGTKVSSRRADDIVKLLKNQVTIFEPKRVREMST